MPTFTVVAPPPANDNFANAMAITSNSFTDTKDSSGATTETSDPTPPCPQRFAAAQGNTGGHPNGAYNTIWYRFSPTSGGAATLDFSGSNYDPVLSILTGSAGSFASLACNIGTVGPDGVVVTKLQNVSLTGRTTYYIMVSSFGPPGSHPVAS